MSSIGIVIPILLGGSRLRNKNIALIDGQPLCTYVINTVSTVCNPKDINILYEQDLVVNSIKRTEPYPQINFLKRNPHRGGSNCTMETISSKCSGERCQVHDHYLQDIFEKLEYDWIIQIHTTSPLLSRETVIDFIEYTKKSTKNMIHSVVKFKKESLISNVPINFSLDKKTPTQDLNPVDISCWALTAWKRDVFLKKIKENKSPSFDKNMDTFPIPFPESIDIDTFEEFQLAENILRGKRLGEQYSSKNDILYFKENILGIERDLQRLLSSDGSAINTGALNNLFGKISIEEIVERMGADKSWSYPIMVFGQDQACVIQQQNGEACRNHYHITKAEFWIVMQGEFEWILEDRNIKVKKGEFMRLRPGEVHTIKCISEEPGIRFAMGGIFMEHIYV